MFLTQNHERRVDGNPRKPGGETGSFLEIFHVNEGFQETVLKRILGILPIPVTR